MLTRELIQERETPFYAYDLNLLEETLRSAQEAAGKFRYKVHYALKANPNPVILERVIASGMGIDCVSGRELELALAHKVDPSKIVLAGVGKTDREISTAIEEGIYSLNVESINELEVIEEIASGLQKTVRIAFRLNPNVDAGTHKFITTGKQENKFGISSSELEEALEFVANSYWLDLKGIHFHIGSQILELTPFVELCSRVESILEIVDERGFKLDHVNLGGGLGVNYLNPDVELIPNFKVFFETINRHLKTHLEVHFELGRSLTAQCGSLVTRALYNKTAGSINYVVVDAGMTELMRPALYGAHHKIQTLHRSDTVEVYNVVGPVCESTDTFGEQVTLPTTKRGDLLVIRSAGAYGESMASNYNLRRLNEPLYFRAEVSV